MATRIWTEVAMNRIHYLRRIGRFAAALAGLAAARAAFGATPAFAVRYPEPGPPRAPGLLPIPPGHPDQDYLRVVARPGNATNMRAESISRQADLKSNHSQ
jgi:hypothetical protein